MNLFLRMIWKMAWDRDECMLADVTPEVRTLFPCWISRNTSSTQRISSSLRPTTWTCCLASSRTRSFCLLFSKSNTCDKKQESVDNTSSKCTLPLLLHSHICIHIQICCSSCTWAIWLLLHSHICIHIQICCSSCTWAIWLCFSYCTDAQLITLAQLSTASDIQTILAHIQVSARASAGVPDQTLCTDFFRLGSVSALIGRWQPAGGTKNTNIYVRSASVLYIWSGSLEHFVVWATWPVHLTWLF